MNMKCIPTKVHGILDYVVAIVLVLAPIPFGFSEVGGAAVVVPTVLGIALFVYSLLTKYEWGVFKVLSMPYHLMIDMVAAIFLALSPFLFGFVNEAPNAWLPHVVVGIAVILVVLFSEKQPGIAGTPADYR